jgi:[acyl-carrier-protein] S-malonyltransferase
MSRKGFIFPGQGTQYVGMARDFYEEFSVVQQTFQEASDLLSYDWRSLILEGDEKELSLTCNSQPAIFIVSSGIFRCMQKEFPFFQPAVCGGLSLGEYTALYGAGILSFAETLSLVAARGKFMQEACLENPGTMRIVLGIDPEGLTLPENVWVANRNCPGQVVIAGSLQGIAEAEGSLRSQGAKKILSIDVSGAFHTPLMKSAEEKLSPLILSANFKKSSCSVVMNVPGDFVFSTDLIRKFLIAQVSSLTHWEQDIKAMDREGVSLYVEIGPGKTLTGMNKKIGVSGQFMNIEKVSDLKQLESFYGSS